MPNRLFDTAGPDLVTFDKSPGIPPDGAEIEQSAEASEGRAIMGAQHHVCRHALVKHQPGALPVLRHITDPKPTHAFGDGIRGEFLSIEADRSGSIGPEPGDHLCEFGLSIAVDPRHADYLSFVDVEAETVEGTIAALSGRSD